MARGAPSVRSIFRSLSCYSLLVVGVSSGTLAGVSSATVAVAPHKVKMSLPRSIPPKPVFLTAGVCGYFGPNNAATCNAGVLKAINNARRTEPLGPVPKTFDLAAFDRLSRPAQIFAIADIERTARGLPPMAGLTSQLDAIAERAAVAQTDPNPKVPLHITRGGTATAYGSNWAEGAPNPLAADYYWMYDDGLNSPNATCTKQNRTSCWGHRENILFDWEKPAYCVSGSAVNLLMGVAEVTKGVAFSPSITELFVNDCGRLPTRMLVTWPQVEKVIFGH